MKAKLRRIVFDQDEKPPRELTAYKFSGKTGIYCGQRQVHGERYGSGDTVYQFKLNETMEEPPIVEDGQIAVFLERLHQWVVIEDYRKPEEAKRE